MKNGGSTRQIGLEKGVCYSIPLEDVIREWVAQSSMTPLYRQAQGALTAEPKDIAWQSAQDQEARAPVKVRKEKEKDQKGKDEEDFNLQRVQRSEEVEDRVTWGKTFGG